MTRISRSTLSSLLFYGGLALLMLALAISIVSPIPMSRPIYDKFPVYNLEGQEIGYTYEQVGVEYTIVGWITLLPCFGGGVIMMMSGILIRPDDC